MEKIMRFRYLFFLSLTFMLVACLGGGGGNGSTNFIPSDTLDSGITLSSYPHQIDFYVPTGATRAIVFLHGALGTNFGMANSLGINTNTSAPTIDSVKWNWLEDNKVLAAFPQGQAAYSIFGDPITTWSNHVMNSGQDDMGFLKVLVSYISSHYHITDVYLAGHSNGGMMANRVWCEDPTLFKAYIAMSGPASDYYFKPPPSPPPTPAISTNGSVAACNPSTVQPYMGIVGDNDTVLQIANYTFTNPTYAINSAFTSSPAVLDPVLIGEWYMQKNIRLPLMCSETLDSSVPTSTDGATNTWTSCSGKLELKEVLNAGHSIDSLQTSSGYQMIDWIISFIDHLP